MLVTWIELTITSFIFTITLLRRNWRKFENYETIETENPNSCEKIHS